MWTYLTISLLAGLTAIGWGLYQAWKITGLPQGSKEANAIAQAISDGASAFLARQSKTVAVIAAFLAAILWFAFGAGSALAFVLGAVCSALAGFAGMSVAVRANLKTAVAAKKGLAPALAVAFSGGSVTGLMVAGLALLAVGVTLAVLLATSTETSPNLTPLVALGFGGSLISVFARLGGGIYTKGADVGTDMVGKIEKGIPEDDPRNPGVIADLVGDNVGDDAGMAADIFETYVVTAVAVMLLGQLTMPNFDNALVFPLLVGAAAIVASIVGTFFVRLGPDQKIMPALYRGLVATIIFSGFAFCWLIPQVMTGNGQYAPISLFSTSILGLILTLVMVGLTEYFTAKNSGAVKKIALASQTGHGTNVIAGLALSMKSTTPAVLLIAGATLLAYSWAGLYGIATAVMSMLSLTVIIVSIDAFGPITDNAGGIAEMSGEPPAVRKVTDALDAVGNTTKAVTKAYAIASAGLAALVLFASYTQELTIKSLEVSKTFIFSLSDPTVLVGLLIGASIPYLFAAFAMEAVGKAAESVVIEVRRQFKEIQGIMQGKNKPDYKAAVDIVTRAALRQMLIPAILPVAVPIIVGVLLGAQALGGLLVGTIVTGLFVAISMTTGGAAWDNAKKYIEAGNLGGKGSPAHQAAVTGDTVGDPYKDTAGPAINPMIKVVNIVALLIAGFLK